MPTVGWLANWKREIKWKWYSFEIEFHRNAKNFTRRGPKKSVEVEWVKGEGGGGRHDWMMANWTRNYRIERAVNASVKVSLACSRDSNESEGEGVERRSQRGRRKRGTERKSEIENGRERERDSKRKRGRVQVSRIAVCALPKSVAYFRAAAENRYWNLLHNLALSLPLLHCPFVILNLILSTFSFNIQSSKKTRYTLCKFVA